MSSDNLLLDIYNFTKTFVVHEMAKAEDVLHSPTTPTSEILIASGAHYVLKTLFDRLTNGVQEHNDGKFNFKEETHNMFENIKTIDPFLCAKATPATVSAVPAEPVEGEVDLTEPTV